MWSLRKRRFRKAFGDFLSSDVIDAIVDNRAEHPEPQRQQVCFIILQVRDDSPEDIQRFVSQACDILQDGDSLVEDMMSSVIFAVLQSTSAPMDRLIENLLTKLGQNIRIAYGQGAYLRGLLGSELRFNYGTILPHFSKALEDLLKTEYGSSTEVRC